MFPRGLHRKLTEGSLPKCDEGRPQCQRCCNYGVLCNFTSSGIPDLHPSAERQSFALKSSRQVVEPNRQSLRPPLGKDHWTADATSSFAVDARSRELLSVYRAHSIHLRDDTPWTNVKDEFVRMAFTVSTISFSWLSLSSNVRAQHPFLMHGILALTAGYCRSLTSELPSRASSEELLHISQCTSLFRARLASPVGLVSPVDKDALWAAASTLGVLAFSSLDATSAADSWPLTPTSPSDLEWMRISEGKMAVYHVVDPLRPESLFSAMASTYAQVHAPLPMAGIDGISPRLAKVCNLQGSSTAESSPFFTPAHAISKLCSLSDSHLTTGRALAFLAQMPTQFKSLLHAKDPVALLLLYLWYCKARLAVWWVDLRARVECPAILLFLQQYHPNNTSIHEFLIEHSQVQQSPNA